MVAGSLRPTLIGLHIETIPGQAGLHKDCLKTKQTRTA